MIKRLINKILKSINNLPAQYKVALARILTGIMESIMALEENKVDKEEGKELSSNDFTDELKEKLENLPEEFIQENADWESESGVTKILNKPNLTVYPDSAEWDKTTKKIYFKNQGTILNPFTIDGTDFIKDGMIDEVKIENDKLVIIFNTDSGKETIEIPLSEIFNPDNYYTKDKTDELFVKKVNGKDLSSNDFTDELKEKLENLKDSDSFIMNLDNVTSFEDLVDFLDNGGDPKKCIFNFTTTMPHDTFWRQTYMYGGKGFAFGTTYIKTLRRLTIEVFYINRKCILRDAKGNAVVNEDLFGNLVTNANQDLMWHADKSAYHTGPQIYSPIVDSLRFVKENCYPTIAYIDKLLGNITSYTNEEIEQLIAQGYDVKVFKLDMTEDKTLLKQILVDNPEDGSIDITQALYFVYDSNKQKYYDVNSITIETVESDRQINIVAANDRYDYTAIKINTDEAEYVINPSHVESNNADWQENDEDKASYVKNRTHYGEKNPRYNTILGGYIYEDDIELDDLDINDAIDIIKQYPNSSFNIWLPFDMDYQGFNTELRIWRMGDGDNRILIGQDDSSISDEFDSIEEAFALFTTVVDNKYYYNKDARVVIIDDEGRGEFVFYNRFNDIVLYEYINIKQLDSAYLEDLTDEEINQILE